MRKFLIFFIFLLITIALFWVGYFGWQRLGKKPFPQINDSAAIEELRKSIGNIMPSGLNQITDNAIASYWLSASTSDIFIVNYNGKINKISGKNKTVVSDNGLKNISQLIPSPDKLRALINLTIFDTTNNTWTTLPAETTSAVWNPNPSADQIVYLKNDGLYFLNLKNNKSSLFLKLNNQDLQVSWPTTNEIRLSDKPSASGPNNIWSVNVKNKTITKLNDEARPNVLTLLGKCITADAKTYCAVPQNLPPETVLPDDYLKRKIYTNDDFYAGDKLLVKGSEDNPVDAVNLLVRDDKLFFINRYDQKLYSLEIRP